MKSLKFMIISFIALLVFSGGIFLITHDFSPVTKDYSQVEQSVEGYGEKVKYANVTYAKNDGSGSTTTSRVNIGGTRSSRSGSVWWTGCKFTVGSNSFSRSGYNFSTWNTSSNGSGTSYSPGSTYTFGTLMNDTDASVSLHAQWSIITYSISYTLNSGSVSGNPTSYNVTSSAITLKNPTRTGYTFTGWTGSNGSTPQTSVTISSGSTGNRSYTANWSAINYSISYTLDNGSVSGNPTSYNITSSAITLKNPTRTGYTFTGWTGSNGSTPQTSVTIPSGSTGNKSYTANWSIITYTISYSLAQGSASTTPAHGASHPTSATYNTSFTVNNPTMTGYNFTGWNITGMDGVTHTYGSNTTSSTSISKTKETSFKNLRSTSGTVTFTATWEKKTTSVTFSANKLTNMSGTPSQDVGSSTFYFDTEISIKPKASVTGWTFNGYYTSASGGSQIFDANGNVKAGVSGYTSASKTWIKDSTSVTLYAQWTAISYKLTVNPNGGTYSGSTSSTTVTQNYDTSYTLSAPTRTGYTFAGWSGGTQYLVGYNNFFASDANNKNGYNVSTRTGYTFNGSDNALQYNNYPTVAGATYACWVYVSSFQDSHVIDHRTSDGGTGGYQPLYFYSDGGMQIWSAASPSAGDAVSKSTTGFNTGSWYHIVIKYSNDGNAYLYVNGVQKWSAARSVSANSSTLLTLGQRINGINKLSGQMKLFGVVNGELTQSDVSALYNLGNNTTSAMYYWRFTSNQTLTAQWVPNTYTVTLDKQGGSGGTDNIYEKYDTGYYTNSGATTQMTTSANPISIPTKVGYTFAGYYTETSSGTQYIDENGYLTSDVEKNNFSADGTLYAYWTETWAQHTTEPTISNGFYQIDTKEKLAWFMLQVNSGNTSHKAKQTANINLSEYDWYPIGTSANKFSGMYDGQGYQITGLKVHGDVSGLFGYVSTGTATNVYISGATIFGQTKAGGIVADASGNSTISQNVVYNSTISGGTTGGIVGTATSGVTIRDCIYYNDNSVTLSGVICGSGGTVADCLSKVNGTIQRYNVNETNWQTVPSGMFGDKLPKALFWIAY